MPKIQVVSTNSQPDHLELLSYGKETIPKTTIFIVSVHYPKKPSNSEKFMNNENAPTAHNLMLSPTMERIDRFAQALQIDVRNKEDLNMVLKSVLLPLVFAVDDDQIIFNDANARIMFHGLMAFAFEFITEANKASMVKDARMH